LSGKIIKQIFGSDNNGDIQNHCPSCNSGKLFLKLGKYGAFLGCSNYPDCKYIRQIFKESLDNNSGDDAKKSTFEPRSLGIDPKTSCEILVKIGPYGAYLELAGSEMKSTIEELKKDLKKSTKTKNSKPKRVSLPKNLDPATIEIDSAIKLLALPRELGIHPETEQKIIANIGPYGPYIAHNGKFISVKEDNILEIGLNRAIDLIFNHSSKDNGKTSSNSRFSKVKQISKSTAKKENSAKKTSSKTSKTAVKKTKK
ncbi:MAG: topoisomerase DNA-binding C4 zinc finger domain-containing protein, partial [Rickettsiales bacterium]|nr:topoisomerase DNA-binding C4 zinc finger domain-containing protein [Rickettsiales bacterium]